MQMRLEANLITNNFNDDEFQLHHICILNNFFIFQAILCELLRDCNYYTVSGFLDSEKRIQCNY